MDTSDDIQLHELSKIEENLATEREPTAEAADAFVVPSASGFMVPSASGFMVPSASGFMVP